MQPRSLFSLAEHLGRLSKNGDPLEVLAGMVNFERFRPLLTRGLGYSDGAKGGRPPFDPVAMVKVLVVQAQHKLSDAGMEFIIRDRLSWMRFFGFDLGGTMPDENTIRHYRGSANRELDARGIDTGVRAATARGRLSRPICEPARRLTGGGGQIADARLVPAPKQRNNEEERTAIKVDKAAKQIWRGKPNKAHQKVVDARCTVKIGGKIRYRPDGTPLPQIATPVFGYKSHISIDRRFGFIRKAAVTSAAHSDGRQLRRVIDTSNTASDVWADSAYRSQKNETWLARNMLTSRIHRRKPKGQPMPARIARANAVKSAVRAKVEHVFAHQKNRYGLFIRTIGLARAQAKLALANLVYNFDRLIFHERRAATG